MRKTYNIIKIIHVQEGLMNYKKVKQTELEGLTQKDIDTIIKRFGRVKEDFER